MKLLGWMHSKIMQNNSTDHVNKNCTIGNHPARFSKQKTLSSEQHHYTDPHSNIKCKRSLNTFESKKVDEESIDEPFDFLLIGTFGTKLLKTNPPTPTLYMPGEALNVQEPIEATKCDGNLISYELEKFLEAEEMEITNNDSSQSTSEASVITQTNDVCVQTVACPLQNYLFGASVEMNMEVKTRTPVEKLFKESNIADGDDDGPMKKVGKQEDGKGKGHVGHFMKKVKIGFAHHQAQLILVKMFHKKVYPEEMTNKHIFKASKYKNRKNILLSKKDGQLTGNNKKLISETSKKKLKSTTIKLCWNGIYKGSSPEYEGHWIKTDSDYFILEL